MKLIYKHGEARHFQIIKYPDGQQNVELDLEYFNDPKQPIIIECSIRNWSELEILLCLIAALEKNDFTISHVDFKYMFGMRSDRSFDPGQPNYFRDVIAPVLNTLPCKLTFMSPHSLLAISALKNAGHYPAKSASITGDCFVIGADKSAEWYDYFRSEFHFIKTRSWDDSINVSMNANHQAVLADSPSYKPILVMDDLCDGGGTFIAIAKWLDEHFSDRHRYLYVIHGLFTKGIDELLNHYAEIYVTNSYQEIDHPSVKVIDVWK